MENQGIAIALVTAICGAIVTIVTAVIGYFTLAKKTELESWEEKVVTLKAKVEELELAFTQCSVREAECHKAETELRIKVVQLSTRLEFLEKQQ